LRRGELFDLTELRAPPSHDYKNTKLRRIVDAARYGAKYTYTLKEAAGILNVSRDVADYLIHTYRMDALAIGVIYRIPRYSLAEYILDQGEDIDKAFYKYIRSRHKPA
jgi:excisionase family DNA binding protein